MVYFAKWKIILVVAVCALGILYAAPNLLDRRTAAEISQVLPEWMPTRQINLGLDLRGGSHLLLRVDWEAVVAERLESLADSLRSQLRSARSEPGGDRLGYTNLAISGQSVMLTLTDPAAADRLREIVREIDPNLVMSFGSGGAVSIQFSEAELTTLRNNAVNQSIEIVRRRIDELGTAEPSIQRQGEDRILVQLPGLGDWRAAASDRLEDLLPRLRTALQAAAIGFSEIRIEDLTARIPLADPQSAEGAVAAVSGLGESIEANVEPGGTIAVGFTQAYLDDLRNDVQRVRNLLGQTARLAFHLVDTGASPAEALAGRPPPGSMVLPSAEVGPDGQPETYYVVRRRVNVSGDTLTDAQPTFQDGRPVVSFSFDSQGARRFADTTRDNVGRQLAIVLDGKVISAPVIRSPILGGQGIIEGGFTVQSASDLALLLRAGALPAPLTVLEERTVGPGLGADSIAAGETAAMIGFALVIVFMILSYGFFGILASIALVFNMVIIFAALSALQATLTLPGIAGIVLTIGMAVDANVLIFERIREEVRNGRSPISAIDAGYSRAMTTIIDSNVTTLFATTLLFLLGSGPVRGFAITLTIGITVSMFTAIMLTRLMVVTWLRRTRPKAIPI